MPPKIEIITILNIIAISILLIKFYNVTYGGKPIIDDGTDWLVGFSLFYLIAIILLSAQTYCFPNF